MKRRILLATLVAALSATGCVYLGSHLQHKSSPLLLLARTDLFSEKG